MKTKSIMALLLGAALAPVSGQTLIWGDTFDAPDSGNFDASPLAGRLSGSLASETYLRSAGVQQNILACAF